MGSQGIFDRYVNFYTDFAFKKLFGTEVNKELLISFLNALFAGREEIEDITYLNTEHLGTQERDRKAVFDVYCKNTNGERFIVEMQKCEQHFIKDRALFYSTYPIREQAQKGSWNYELKGVYTICILNFCLGDMEQDPSYRHEIKLMDVDTKKVFYDKLTFIYLEMPKFTKDEDELESLFDKWMYAIRHLAMLYERPKALQEACFTHLFEMAEIGKFNKAERYEYEESLKNYRDWYSIKQTQVEKGEKIGIVKGEKIGIVKGEKIGIVKGEKIGIVKGEKKATERIANKMLSSGMSLEEVSRFTSLSIQEIKSIANKK